MTATRKPKSTSSQAKSVRTLSEEVEAQPARRYLTPAEILTKPTVMGLVAAKTAAKAMLGEVDDTALEEGVAEQVRAIAEGDLSSVEAMLYSQAKALETLFTNLLRRGMACETIATFQANLGTALKAQAQCRATLQTLIEAKQPRAVAFVRQANIARQLQVNNEANIPRAGEITQHGNELLEDDQYGQEKRMVAGTQAAPTGSNRAMEAVGAIDRAEDARG